MSKDRFRSLVAIAVNKLAMKHLNNVTQGHSKSEEDYFADNRFSRSEIDLLFALHTRMVPGIKANFPSQYNDVITCDLCHVAVCCQEHVETTENCENV